MVAAGAGIAAIAIAPIASAFMQLPDEPAPESGTSQVVAQGVIDISEGDVRWQVVERIAPPPANAAPSASDPGFLTVNSGVVLVENRETGEQHRLPAGEAMLSPAGADQLRIALGTENASYFDFELVSADLEAPEDGDVLFASEPFAGPGARHDVDLVQDALGPGLQMSIPAGSLATLVVINDGTADVTTESGDVLSLGAGEAAALAGALVVTAGANGANVSAVYTGPAVPLLTQGTGTRAASTPAAGTPAAGRVVEVETPTPQEPDASPVATVEPDQEAAAIEDPDEDGDGLTTAQERDAGTDAALADTDEDGLTDGQEVLEFGTDPLSADSDGDGLLDGDEVAQGADPLDGLATAAETVAEDVAPAEDAASVAEEPAVVEEPAAEVAPAVAGDSDGDGLEDTIEAELGTDPFDIDTDDDGLSDGDEYYNYQTGTRNPDTDADGILDGDEAANGTNPNDPASA